MAPPPAVDDDITEIVNVKSEASTNSSYMEESPCVVYNDYSDYSNYQEDSIAVYDENTTENPPARDRGGLLDSYMTRVRDAIGNVVGYSCNSCQKNMKRKDHMNNHVQTHFPNQEVTCDICGTTCKNLPSLNVHKSKHRADNRKADSEIIDANSMEITNIS